MQIFVRNLNGRSVALDVKPSDTVSSVKKQEALGIPCDLQGLVFAGRQLQDGSTLAACSICRDCTLHLVLRLRGGKGGFGSLLRSSGRAAQTSNFDACRDLSGRRLRHVNADQKLQDWVKEEKERELEKLAMKHVREQEKAALKAVQQQVDVHTIRKEQDAAIDSVLSAVQAGLGQGPLAVKRKDTPQLNRKRNKKPRRHGFTDDQDGVTSSDDSDMDEATVLPPTVGILHAGAAAAAATAGTSSAQPSSAEVSGRSAEFAHPIASSDGSDTSANVLAASAPPAPASAAACAPTATVVESAPAGGPQTGPQAAPPAQKPTSDPGGEPGHVDLQRYASAAELEALGPEVLKRELSRHGLKCGGTLTQRAERLFLLATTPLDKLERAHFAKPANK